MTRSAKVQDIKGNDIKAVCFDIGFTLLFPEPSLGAIYAMRAAAHGLYLSRSSVEERFQQSWKKHKTAADGLIYGTTHDHATSFWEAVAADVFAPLNPNSGQIRSFTEDVYKIFAESNCWRINPFWFDMLAKLRKNKLKIAFISNWDLRLRQLLRNTGLLHQADVVSISAEAGIEKPDAAIFQQTAAELGLPSDQCLHIGDSWVEDIEGASSAGMQTVWFNPTSEPTPVSNDDTETLGNLLELTTFLSL